MTAALKFRSPGSLVYVPSPTQAEEALARTTHLGIGAHQDDLEIFAFHGILSAFRAPERWFSGVTMARGSGGPRAPQHRELSEGEMTNVRREEQMAAADLGRYSSQVFLDYSSAAVRDRTQAEPTADLLDLLSLMRPEVIYTHALSDRHSTHVAVALRVIDALRALAPERRPSKLLGCEVWGDLDWLPPPFRVELDVSGQDALAEQLLSTFTSQVGAGKAYHHATLGRRAAHATFGHSDSADSARAVTLAMDLTPLLSEPSLDPADFLDRMVETFRSEARGRLQNLPSPLV